ncbi:MAG: cytidylate kinase-like family protein [Vulcanimicrobiaceae bacterium]
MIVTISNSYGSGAVAIAHELAVRTGYEVVDRQLPVVVAKRLHVLPEEVEAAEAGKTVGERVLAGLELATPELTLSEPEVRFDEACLREVQEAVRAYAAKGDVIFLGRAAFAILGRRRDVLRTFLHAPRDWRIHHVAEDLRVDERVAAAEVDRIDTARRAHVRDWYGLDWGDPKQYDLCIDTAGFGMDAVVELLVQAVRSRR